MSAKRCQTRLHGKGIYQPQHHSQRPGNLPRFILVDLIVPHDVGLIVGDDGRGGAGMGFHRLGM